ncbi:MAG: ABC transporter permease [Treponema sp.]|nr:ABC transporter permease [Treponema sp.]
MRIKAIVVRILQQMRHDRRTLALMLAAPLLVLTLIYFVLQDTNAEGRVAIISAPGSYVSALADYNINTFYYDAEGARGALEKGDVDATIRIVNGKSYIEIDGSNASQARMVLNALEMAKLSTGLSRPDLQSDVNYVYGYDDLSTFDNIGTILIGFMIFFFVFLIAGISFLQERTTGTLEKLLSTPIRRWEIVSGYVLGFGIVTVIQSVLFSLYVVYVLGAMMIGSLLLVLVITFWTAIMALTLGILLSTAANNEFQMIQFVPVVIVPQVFFSGLFQLTPLWETVGKFMPLHYVADALKEVMIKGNGFQAIWADLLVMVFLSVLFMIINTFLLKRYRRI